MNAPTLTTRAGRLFYRIATITALAVGALQMYHVRAGLLTDYGADVFGTAWLFAMTRLGRTIFQRGHTLGAGAAGVIVFVLCAISEIGQKMKLVPGRYDPYDLVAYAGTVVVCVIVDRLTPLATKG